MSNENPVYTNQVVVTLEGDDQNNVSWSVRADDSVVNSMHTSFEELARAGAPLSVMGIRALYEFLCDHMVVLALEKGNLYQCREYLKARDEKDQGMVENLEGTLGGDVEEGIVVH